MKLPAVILACLYATAQMSSATAATLRLVDFEDRPVVWRCGEGVSDKSQVSLTHEQVHGGRVALKLDYTFELNQPGTLNYVGFGVSAVFAGRPTHFALWVYGDASDQPIRLRVSDASGETFQYNLAQVSWTGWKQVVIALERDDVHWGGDGNGQWDLPLRLDSVLVDSARKPFASTLCFDDLSYVAEVPAVDQVMARLETGSFGGIYWAGDEISAPTVVLASANMEQSVAGRVTVEVVGPRGQPVGEWTTDFELPPDEAWRRPIHLPPAREGLFRVTVTLDVEGVRRQLSDSFAYFARPHDTALDPQSFFGACTHFGQGKGDVPRSFDLMSRAGIKWLRDEIYWGAVEREKGQYTIPDWADRYMRAAVEHGVTPLIIFNYSCDFYDQGNSPTSPEAQEAFGNYCFALVNHFKDFCKHWEVYNEPNIGFWRPQPDPGAYTRLLKVAYQAAKRADPGCTVVGVCTAGTDLRFIEEVLKRGGMEYMDALSVHPYRYPGSPEQTRFVEELTRAHQLMEEYGGGHKKLWLTEIGWPTHREASGVSEEVSGNYLIRMHVLAMTLPFVERVFWYDFQDDGLDPMYNEHNFGLIRWQTFTPKQNYVAAKMLTEHLTGAQFVRRLLPADENDPRHCYEFSRGGKPVLVAWSAGRAGTLALQLGTEQVELSWADAHRERRELPDGNLTLAVGEMPVFIAGNLQEVTLCAPAVAVEFPQSPLAPGESGTVVITAPLASRVEANLSPQLPVSFPDGLPARDGEYPFTVDTSATPGIGDLVIRALGPDGRERASAATTLEIVQPLRVALAAPEVREGNITTALRVANTRRRALEGVRMRVEGPVVMSTPLEPLSLAGEGSATISLTLDRDMLQPGHRESVDVTGTTPAGGEVRERFSLVLWQVPRAQQAPTVDGDGGEWPQTPTAVLGMRAEDFWVLRPGAWTGPDDLSTRLRLLWDENALYVLVEVTDDRHVQTQHGGEVWRSDNVQLALDDGFASWKALDANATAAYPEIGLSRTGTGEEVYRWLWREGAVAGVQLRTARTGNCTTYEASIPWEEMKAAAPQPGAISGFSLLVNEDDGEGRDGWLELTGGIGYGKDPRKFGILQFAP